MKINNSSIKKSIRFLEKDECIAIPTETVYGLGANAYSNVAILKIFKIKKSKNINNEINAKPPRIPVSSRIIAKIK